MKRTKERRKKQQQRINVVVVSDGIIYPNKKYFVANIFSRGLLRKRTKETRNQQQRIKGVVVDVSMYFTRIYWRSIPSHFFFLFFLRLHEED